MERSHEDGAVPDPDEPSPVQTAQDKRVVRQLRTRAFDLVPADIVLEVLESVEEEQRNRATWMDLRLARYAKLRGWLEEKDYPWEDASNVHVPVMMADCLRVKAGLFNAVLGLRPVMTAKPERKALKEAAERVDHLIDHQVFVEADGETMIERYIDQFVEDGTVVSFQPWSRERQVVRDVRVIPKDGRPRIEQMADQLPTLFPGLTAIAASDADGADWTATTVDRDGEPTEVTLTVYDKDDRRWELLMEWTATVFDGPTPQVHRLEDVVVPMRSENLQPITQRNPNGAPWVARLVRVTLDTIRRRQKDGTYDLLSTTDLKDLEAVGSPRQPQEAVASGEDAITQAKEDQAGLSTPLGGRSRDWFTVVEWYGRWDVNGDELDEDVIVWVLKETRQLLRARYLTEVYPGLPIRRPFSESRYITVPGQFYGIGLPELMEGLHDLLHTIFNQNLDAGTLTNRMFFFYRASSGFKPEVIRLWPGEGYPLDNPQTDVHFPVIPQRDQSWSLNMIGLVQQMVADLTQIGPLQKGQVPQGKASALRTLGTTMAILQQGAAMPEQILRRLFMGLKQVWGQIHLLNTRYLPKGKRYLVTGVPADQEDAYGEIADPGEIQINVNFDFQATLLNTNKGVVSQALVSLGTALVNPLMLQAGLITPEQIYNWAKDLIQAAQLDPGRYLKRPAGIPEGPRMLWEEALTEIMDGRLPEVAPLEDPQEHWAKMQKFLASDEVGFLTPQTTVLFKEYLKRYLAYLRQQMQQQQLMAAAQDFSTRLGNEGQGQGAQPQGEVPGMQTEMATQPEMAGAAMGRGR